MLDASIRYLEELKREGRRYVTVAPENLELLRTLRRPPANVATAPVPARSAPPDEPGVTMNERAATLPASVVAPKTDLAPVSPILSSAERLTGPAKVAAMTDLRERALACVKCPHLVRSRTHVVFGVGNPEASLMFVGEAPGIDEDQAGEPFVGRAGQLLTKMIEAMGMKRSDVYIANILKCRPDTPGQSSGNRKPTLEEMQTCIPYLHAQIDLIGPKVLVALGATALEGLLGKTGGIMRARGHWHEYRNIPLMPTYHPAYLLRNQAREEKRRVWEDMLAVMQKLNLPISERQQGFFK